MLDARKQGEPTREPVLDLRPCRGEHCNCRGLCVPFALERSNLAREPLACVDRDFGHEHHPMANEVLLVGAVDQIGQAGRSENHIDSRRVVGGVEPNEEFRRASLVGLVCALLAAKRDSPLADFGAQRR